MNIRELYITDVNNEGDFWSEDKILKLNDMFTQLGSGLQPGADGSMGPGGGPGLDGATGVQGGTGGTGPLGPIGTSGQSLWTRTIDGSGLETLSLASNSAGVILGGTSALSGATCDGGTVISTAIPAQGGNDPSALRLHAINDTGGTLRKHIRLKSRTFSATPPADKTAKIHLDPATEIVYFDSDKIDVFATNILIYDGSSVVSVFTDAGIVITSDLVFAASTIQTFKGDVILSSGLYTNHPSSRLWTDLVSGPAHDFIENATQVIYGENLYRYVYPDTTHNVTVATGPTHTSGAVVVDTLKWHYVGPASIAAKFKAANPTTTLTGKHLVFNTGLSEGNLEFKDMGGLFTSFPRWSIIQVPYSVLKTHFNIHGWETSMHTSTSWGFEMKIGRGEGPYAGWYICHEHKWRTPLGFSPTFSKQLPTMNLHASLIQGDWIQGDGKLPVIGGGKMQFNIDHTAGQIAMLKYDLDETEIYMADDGTSGGGHQNLWLGQAAYICLIDPVDPLVWYTDPPTPPPKNTNALAN